jgi:hypothetical protein
MYLAQLLHARTSRQLSGTDWSVLVHLQLELDPVEFRPVKINAIRHELGLKFSPTARSVRRLIEFGYLGEGGRHEGLRTYRLRVPAPRDRSVTTRAA